MPVSQRPRKPRGTPQYRRDLQTMEKPVTAHADALSRLPDRPPRTTAVRRGHSKLALAGGGLLVAGAVGASAHSRRIAHDLKRKEETSKSLKTLATPERIQTAARMVDAAVGAAAKPAPKATRARSAARAAASASVPKATKRKATLKLVGGGVGATAGAGALFGAGSGLGHRATDRRTTTAKAHYPRTVDGTNVRRVTTPKGPTGRFVSHENDLKVFTPKFKSTRRAPRGSKLQTWRKGGDAASKPWVSKLHGGRDALNPNRRGTRLS
jgi:hypothetical protein